MKLYYRKPECKEDYDRECYDDYRHDKCKCDKCRHDKCDHDKCHCDKCPNDEHKFAHCCPKSPCPYPIIFECAQGTGTEITRTIPNGLSSSSNNFFHPRSLGCLTVDTSCLKNPVVKFDFCSIIKFRSDGDQDTPVRLVFQLSKVCDDKQEVSCGTWDYVVALDTEDERITTSFCFSHCECNSCPGCCVYTVKLIEAVNVVNGDILIVYNPTLSAIAKSSC